MEREDERSAGDQPSGLFRGMSFWLSQSVPQRSRFKELIQKNGGLVKLLEKEADILLVDHKKRTANLPPNTYSYQFIEKSIQQGKIADLETCKVGPSAPRPVGATNISARTRRNPFSIQDDQILWDYMQPLESTPGAHIKGNVIYQGLAEKYPQHTYQSWRDRWLKILRERPRPGGMAGTTVASTTGEQDRRQPPSRANNSLTAVVIPQSPPKPQEKKRKRSPEATTTIGLVSNNTFSSHQRSSTGPPPQQSVPYDSLIQSPRREAPPSSKKTKTTAQQAMQLPASHDHSVRDLDPATSSSPKKSKTTTQRPPQESVPYDSLSQGPQHAASPTPKKGQTATNPEKPGKPTESSTKNTTPSEAAQEIDPGINDIFLELPFFPASPDFEQEAPEKDVDAWVEDHLRTGKGTVQQIIEALRCTSMDPELADEVLESMVTGKGIPTNKRGVWTSQDDSCMEAQDTREIQRVLEKHGSDLFNSRWEYLNMARAEGLENQ
ncbi:TRF2-interacting telomeric protein/Rap1 C terminal domain-containing protein [Aspergillus californicus]